MKPPKNFLRKALWAFAALFVFLNVVAFFQAYKLTHFGPPDTEKTKDPRQLSFAQKMKAAVFGVNVPRPTNNSLPTIPYQTFKLNTTTLLECWYIPTDTTAKGTIILFHGYAGHKSSMLDKAEVFRSLGYNTLLPDFMGSGGSEGNTTTIGYHEAQQVKDCYDYVRELGDTNVYLFGTSMGAAAIMKAMQDYDMQPKGVLIECPFGSMYKTVCARFKLMGAPTFPMAQLLMLWGGTMNGFWANNHNPQDYAGSIHCPTLLMWGAKDNKVSREETDAIYEALQGPKTLKVYPNSAHENYLRKYKTEWTADVTEFLQKY